MKFFRRHAGLFALSAIFGYMALSPAVYPNQNQTVVNVTASIVQQAPNGKYIGGWEPKRIVVNQGEKVTLHIRSLDTTHQFFLSGYNLDAGQVNPGAPVTVNFTATKAGTFPFMCHMYCGPDHKKMTGVLVVIPKK